MTYEEFVKKAKQLANAGERSQVEKMLFLVRVHHDPALWRVTWKKNWYDVLRDERLATRRLFDNFLQASIHLGEPELRRLGVRTSARIGSLRGELRVRVLRRVRSWCMEHKVPPEYQLVTEFVRELSPPKTPGYKVKVLLDHIKRQNQLLIENGIQPLAMPRRG